MPPLSGGAVSIEPHARKFSVPQRLSILSLGIMYNLAQASDLDTHSTKLAAVRRNRILSTNCISYHYVG